MDAIDFLKEAHRMCESYDDCEGCPGVAAYLVNDTDWHKNPEIVVDAVEKVYCGKSQNHAAGGVFAGTSGGCTG